MTHDPDEKAEKIAGIVARYRDGQMSEPVFTASLKASGMRSYDIYMLVYENRPVFVQSFPYRRGEFR